MRYKDKDIPFEMLWAACYLSGIYEITTWDALDLLLEKSETAQK